MKNARQIIQRIHFNSLLEQLQLNGKALFITVITALVLMFLAALAVFFVVLDTSEQELTPDVTGVELTDALLAMQAKELFPKIELRYTDSADDKGIVLSQNPSAGTIVKAGRRITLVVGRGIIIDEVGSYTGELFSDVRVQLQTLFSDGTRPLIVLADPLYKVSAESAGTILAQDPPAGTRISAPVTLKLVVSRGNQDDQTTVPNITGISLDELLHVMAESKVLFDFTAGSGGTAGVVTAQDTAAGVTVPNYARVSARIALPKGAVDGKVYGLFTTRLPEYPYPVPLKLEARAGGKATTLATLDHSGGQVSIPYAVPPQTELVLLVVGREEARMMVE